VLGKEREETILRQALAEDLARQVVRRIEALTVAQAPG
jgi:outer membrane lipopolysaccharide assembly protein LptE/RlpB